jgi:phenol hydroxylase P0 protein
MMADLSGLNTGKREFDVEARYVRITGVRNNRLIEFDFSIGEPELFVELVLPFEAFWKFCAMNNVRHLTPEEAAAVDFDKLKWRHGMSGIKG